MTNWFGTWKYFQRECHRFLKVWPQTIGAPLVSSLLYFAIFGGVLGSRIGTSDGVSYLTFLVPGLVAMGMAQHAYQNSSSSLIQMKYLGMVQADLLALPLTPFQTTLAFMGGAMVRGLLVGSVILAVSRIFVPFSIAHPFLFLCAAMLLVAIFGLLGLITGIWSRTFDDVSVIGNFILSPLIYLGGVFFSVSMLPPGWDTLAQFNPVYYLVDLLRQSMLDTTPQVPFLWAIPAVGFIWGGLLTFSIICLRTGWRIKS